jgi:hypothetical protein
MLCCPIEYSAATRYLQATRSIHPMTRGSEATLSWTQYMIWKTGWTFQRHMRNELYHKIYALLASFAMVVSSFKEISPNTVSD